MEKQIGIFSLCLATSGLLAAVPPSPLSPPSPPAQTTQKGCAALSVEEQAFASTLSAANKGMFCAQFNMEQRAAAMNAQGLKDETGNPVSGDNAVLQVAKDNNIMPAKTPGSSGGCSPRK